MTINYRCTRQSCRTRVTRKKQIELYVLAKYKSCPACGGRLSYDPEPKRRASRDVCRCDGYQFPHRKGTEPWCHQAETGPSDEDWKYQAERVTGG